MSQNNITKSSCSSEIFSIDWKGWFSGNTYPFTVSEWSLTGSATLGVAGVAGTVTSVFVIGGTVGEVLALKNNIAVGETGETDCATINIEVIA
jgi:hypothetical protein